MVPKLQYVAGAFAKGNTVLIVENKDEKNPNKPKVKYPGGMSNSKIDEDDEIWLQNMLALMVYYNYPDKFMDGFKELSSGKVIPLLTKTLRRKFLKETGLLVISFELIHEQDTFNEEVHQSFFAINTVYQPEKINVYDIPSAEPEVIKRKFLSFEDSEHVLVNPHKKACIKAKKYFSVSA